MITFYYLAISFAVFLFFVKNKVFYFNRVGSCLGAILASLCWPLGILLGIGYACSKSCKE